MEDIKNLRMILSLQLAGEISLIPIKSSFVNVYSLATQWGIEAWPLIRARTTGICKTLPALLGQGISRVENQQIQVQEVQELNPGHIIGRQVLSPPCQPCSQCVAHKPWSAHAQYQDKKMCFDLYILLDVYILINGSISMSFKDQERSISFSCYWNQLWTSFIILRGDKLKMAAIWIR